MRSRQEKFIDGFEAHLRDTLQFQQMAVDVLMKTLAVQLQTIEVFDLMTETDLKNAICQSRSPLFNQTCALFIEIFFEREKQAVKIEERKRAEKAERDAKSKEHLEASKAALKNDIASWLSYDSTVTEDQVVRLSDLIFIEINDRSVTKNPCDISEENLERILTDVFGNNVPRCLDHPRIDWQIKRRTVYAGELYVEQQQSVVLEENSIGFVNRNDTLEQFMNVMNESAANIKSRSHSGARVPVAEQCQGAGKTRLGAMAYTYLKEMISKNPEAEYVIFAGVDYVRVDLAAEPLTTIKIEQIVYRRIVENFFENTTFIADRPSLAELVSRLGRGIFLHVDEIGALMFTEENRAQTYVPLLTIASMMSRQAHPSCHFFSGILTNIFSLRDLKTNLSPVLLVPLRLNTIRRDRWLDLLNKTKTKTIVPPGPAPDLRVSSESSISHAATTPLNETTNPAPEEVLVSLANLFQLRPEILNADSDLVKMIWHKTAGQPLQLYNTVKLLVENFKKDPACNFSTVVDSYEFDSQLVLSKYMNLEFRSYVLKLLSFAASNSFVDFSLPIGDDENGWTIGDIVDRMGFAWEGELTHARILITENVFEKLKQIITSNPLEKVLSDVMYSLAQGISIDHARQFERLVATRLKYNLANKTIGEVFPLFFEESALRSVMVYADGLALDEIKMPKIVIGENRESVVNTMSVDRINAYMSDELKKHGRNSFTIDTRPQSNSFDNALVIAHRPKRKTRSESSSTVTDQQWLVSFCEKNYNSTELTPQDIAQEVKKCDQFSACFEKHFVIIVCTNYGKQLRDDFEMSDSLSRVITKDVTDRYVSPIVQAMKRSTISEVIILNLMDARSLGRFLGVRPEYSETLNYIKYKQENPIPEQ